MKYQHNFGDFFPYNFQSSGRRNKQIVPKRCTFNHTWSLLIRLVVQNWCNEEEKTKIEFKRKKKPKKTENGPNARVGELINFSSKKFALKSYWGKPEGQGPKRLGWGEIKRPNPVQGPPNHVDLIGNLRVHRRKTPPAWFLRSERRVSLSNQHDFVGLGQG